MIQNSFLCKIRSIPSNMALTRISWFLSYKRIFHTSYRFSGWLVFEKTIFRRFFSVYFYVKIWHPIVALPYPLGSLPEWGCFHTSYSCSGWLILQKRFLKIFPIHVYSYVRIWTPPYRGLTLSLRIMMWTNLNLH